MHSLHDFYKAMLSVQDSWKNLASNAFRFATLFQVFNFCPGIKTNARSVEKIEQSALGDQLKNLSEKGQLRIREVTYEFTWRLSVINSVKHNEITRKAQVFYLSYNL